MRSILIVIAKAIYFVFTFGFLKKYTVSRFGMYKSIESIFDDKSNCKVLSISHSKNLANICGIKNPIFFEANYPDQNILSLKFEDNFFDYVVSDQVFEHIEGDPQVAFDECMRVLKPGGIAIHTTCFMLAYHGPGDYWRWTHEGLKFLSKKHQVIQCDGWGNPFIFVLGFLGLTWSKVPEWRWHPLNIICRFRWPSYSSMVWIVAKKV
jgi:SAM-dependent methyltransferase